MPRIKSRLNPSDEMFSSVINVNNMTGFLSQLKFKAELQRKIN